MSDNNFNGTGGTGGTGVVGYKLGVVQGYASSYFKSSFTINKLKCTPFPEKSVKSELHGSGQFKVAKIANDKNSLTELTVLAQARFGPAGASYVVEAGSKILIRSSEYAAPWGKEQFEDSDGSKFVLIPWERVEIFLP